MKTSIDRLGKKTNYLASMRPYKNCKKFIVISDFKDVIRRNQKKKSKSKINREITRIWDTIF